MTTLKRRLADGETTIGSWITIGHTVVAEIMAKAGFDWLTVDMEHSAITLAEAQQLVQVIDLSGCVPLVRVGANDANLIKRAMDCGAHGVLVPMVNSRDDAERAVSSVRYPPRGTRGVGLARAQYYGADFERYREWNEGESVVIVQVEHIEAVKNLEAIVNVEGVDGFIVGPYDLSGSIGFPGQFEHPEVADALAEVRRVAEQCDTVAGYHVIPPEPAQFIERVEQGFRFVAYSLDILLLGGSSRDGVQTIRRKLQA
jgi:2-dehydro-3-deoxyglucarate aldolase